MIYQRSLRCSLTHLSVILHGIWGKIIRKCLQMADSNKALEMGPGGWRDYGMLPHRELTNGAWGPREWSLNHMGLKTTTSCTKIARRRMEMSSKLIWKIRNTQHPEKQFLALDSYTVAYSSFWAFLLTEKKSKLWGDRKCEPDSNTHCPQDKTSPQPLGYSSQPFWDFLIELTVKRVSFHPHMR